MANIDSWNPDQYEKFKRQRSQPFFDLVATLQPTPNARVIDLGCGTGELTAGLHAQLKATATIGLDSSPEMLKKAQAFAGGSLSFEKGDIKTRVALNTYDVIFSNAALQWTPNHPELFKRLRASLREGGQLAVQMPMNHDYATHIIADEMSREPNWAALLSEPYDKQNYMLKVEDYAALLFELGFKAQNVNLHVYGHELESREGVIEWVKGTLLTYFESRLAPNDFAAFVAEFKTRLFAQLPDQRPFFYPFKRVLMWAR